MSLKILSRKSRFLIKASSYLATAEFEALLQDVFSKIQTCYDNKGKLILFGNGGSYAEASHFVGELVGRYKVERSGLHSYLLGNCGATLTAIANDYDYKICFRRELEAVANHKDLLLLFSTSGSSKNIIELIHSSMSSGIKTVLFTSEKCNLSSTHDLCILPVPFRETDDIQELHLILIHLLCELIDSNYSLQ